jgi:hypothetical protein
MARNRRFTGISDLEREFELDMESEPPDEEAFETDLDEEFEADLDEEYGEEESGEELDQEFEVLAEALEQDADPREMEFAERFYELGQRQFESEFEVDRALTGVLNEMEREYFLGGLAKRLKRSKLVRGLVRKGLNFAQQRLPALKAVTQLARGNLRGALLPLAKTALGTVVPGGPAALTVLKGLGFETAEDAAQNRLGWQNYTRMAREAYETLADNVTMRVDEPREASQLAASAFQQAVGQAQQRAQALASQAGLGTGARRRGGRVIRVRLRPGQKLLVTRG